MTKTVTQNEPVPERPQINKLNTVQLLVTDNKTKKTVRQNQCGKKYKKDKTLSK